MTTHSAANAHRRPCSIPPPLNPDPDAIHQHRCVHNEENAWGTMLEHQCICGMTWTTREQPPPIDTDWITFEAPDSPWRLPAIISGAFLTCLGIGYLIVTLGGIR